jgi:hypothetical protein
MVVATFSARLSSIQIAGDGNAESNGEKELENLPIEQIHRSADEVLWSIHKVLKIEGNNSFQGWKNNIYTYIYTHNFAIESTFEQQETRMSGTML